MITIGSDEYTGDRLAREVGQLMSELRQQQAVHYAHCKPRHPAARGEQVFDARLCGINIPASCDVESGEAACNDVEYGHPGYPPSLEVTHLWINGQWVCAEELLGAARLRELSDALTMETEL